MKQVLADVALWISEWCTNRAESAQDRADRWVERSKRWKEWSARLRA